MKILFCESEALYKSLVGSTPSNVTVEFWGVKYSGKTPSFFKKYAAVMTANFTSPAINLVIMKARLSGVKTAFFSDGIYDVGNSLRNPNLLKYSSYLYDLSIYDYMFVVGDVYIDNTLSNVNVVRYLPKRVLSGDVMKETGTISGVNKVLITTANTPYFTDLEFQRLVVIFTSIIRKLSKYDDTLVKTRIFDERLIDALELRAEDNLINGDFEEVLANMTHVVSTPSSISIPVLKSGLPLLHVFVRPESPSIYSGWLLASEDMIDECLDDFLYDYDIKTRIQSAFLYERFEGGCVEPISFILESTIENDSRVNEILKMRIDSLYSSHLNFNFEYFFRRIAHKIKSYKIYNYLRSIVK